MAVIGATGIEPVNFLEQYAKGLQVGAGRRQLERQEIDRIKAAEQQRAMNELYAQSMGAGGVLDTNALVRGMARQGLGSAIPGFMAGQAEIAQKTAAAAKSTEEANKMFWETSRNQLALIPDNDQAAYQAWATNMVRRAPWTADLLPETLNAARKKRLLMTADMALPKGEVQDIGGGTATINPYTGEQIGSTIANVPDPELVTQSKIRVAQAGAPITKINAYVPASETAQAEFMKSTRTTYDQLKSAPAQLANFQKARRLAAGEARKFMGKGGQALLDVASFLNNRLGFSIDTRGVSDATELRSTLFQGILENLRKLDAQPSQEQQRIMQEALGSLDTDPNALSRVLDVAEDVLRDRVGQFNEEVAGAEARGVKFPYNPIIKLPAKGEAGLSTEDKQALNWARSNPRDARAAEIFSRLGVTQ
jgi:hypothetical protein